MSIQRDVSYDSLQRDTMQKIRFIAWRLLWTVPENNFKTLTIFVLFESELKNRKTEVNICLTFFSDLPRLLFDCLCIRRSIRRDGCCWHLRQWTNQGWRRQGNSPVVEEKAPPRLRCSDDDKLCWNSQFQNKVLLKKKQFSDFYWKLTLTASPTQEVIREQVS